MKTILEKIGIASIAHTLKAVKSDFQINFMIPSSVIEVILFAICLDQHSLPYETHLSRHRKGYLPSTKYIYQNIKFIVEPKFVWFWFFDLFIYIYYSYNHLLVTKRLIRTLLHSKGNALWCYYLPRKRLTLKVFNTINKSYLCKGNNSNDEDGRSFKNYHTRVQWSPSSRKLIKIRLIMGY